jgi:hypothetical protein
METIVNKVKDSGLIQLDLADFKPKIEIRGIDIATQLWQGMILKEKDFREWIKNEPWENYRNTAVYVHCSVDAIIPTWAYMLVAAQLRPIVEKLMVGTRVELEKSLIADKIEQLPLEEYRDAKVIVKGCSDIVAPEFAMTVLTNHLQPVVQNLMYGEPCSTVPIYKKKKG